MLPRFTESNLFNSIVPGDVVRVYNQLSITRPDAQVAHSQKENR